MKRILLSLAAAALLSIAAAAQSPHKVTLSWTASADAATESLTYTVYRAAGACSSGATLAALAPLLTATSYTDTAVTGGGEYCYDVVAVSAAGVVSAPSNQITVSVPLAPPTSLSGAAS
jgi:fibronectin type 3 domain-containing protein